jgi:carbamoyl-phosphate synthase small subunit
MNAVLALEDGTFFRGTAAGATGETSGEVVFNTSMTGYQEVLTDPSYAGQIVTMTSVQIGNYGVSGEDVESARPQVAGFIVRESSPVASNWRADRTLAEYLSRNGIVAIADIDTRALTRTLRSSGVMRGIIATGTDKDAGDPDYVVAPERRANKRLTIAAYDLGIKTNILRRLAAHNCDVRVFPATTPAAELLGMKPDGVFLSNGPGDPAALPYVIDNVTQLVASDTPVFGICLGHQVLGLAMGGKTFKLKFGHRGGNHPVKNLATNRVEITSQNHGFAVDPESLPGDVKVTHLNLYDGTVEGLRHVDKKVFCVQYHPEASPGPHDADYLFRQFLDEIEG